MNIINLVLYKFMPTIFLHLEIQQKHIGINNFSNYFIILKKVITHFLFANQVKFMKNQNLLENY